MKERNGTSMYNELSGDCVCNAIENSGNMINKLRLIVLAEVTR